MTRRPSGRIAPPGDPAAEAQVDAELRFHRESTIAELVAAGSTPEAAEAEARRRFGPAAPYRDRLVRLDRRHRNAQRRRASMQIIAASARAVLRDLRRSPGFTLGVVAILTLGLGVNAITFGLVDRLLLRGPSGIAAPGDLRRVVVHRRDRSGGSIASPDLGYLDYRDLLGATLLAGAAAESWSPVLAGSGEDAERIEGRFVTAGYFPLLGVAPAAGRFFTADESEREGARLAVLGHAYWQRRFGGDPAAIGQTMLIGEHRYTVVGVAPRHFTGSSVTRTDVFLPLEAGADEQVSGEWRTSRNFSWMIAVARLADGASDRAAEEEVTAIRRQAYAEVPEADPDARVELAPLDAMQGEGAPGQFSIAGLVATVALLVLIIAVANAANLFLVRSLRRREAIALRLALGGARARLVVEQGVQGAMLALIGAAVAVGIAWIGAPAVQRLLFPDVAWLESPVDLRLLLAVGAAAVAGGAIAAALPMWQAGRGDVASWLKTSGQRGPRPRTRTQTAMLVVQGTFSVLLLVGAGLFVRSLSEARSLRLGLDVERLLVVSVVPGEAPLSPEFRERLRAAIERMPGVEDVTRVAGTMPFVSSWAIRLRVPGLPDRPRVDDGGPYIHAVEPNYFAASGTRILEGRPLNRDDRAGTPRVVVVNETMARLYWPGESAIGKCLQIGPDEPPCSTVVGVAEKTSRQDVVSGDTLLYYIPVDQAEGDLREGGRLLVRTTDGDLDTINRIAANVRREALAIDPGLRYAAARGLEDIISPQLRSWRLGASLFSTFGFLALVVATIGLYSVVAFNVEGRRREMGVRAALGATGSSIVGLVVRDGLKASAGGVVIGLALAWLLAPLVSDLLYGVPPRDPRVFATATAMLVGAAVLASALPGLRAGRIDPSVALRDD
jgi:predicted permease